MTAPRLRALAIAIACLSAACGDNLIVSHLVTVVTDGHGSVVSDPAGLDCATRCTAAFDLGTEVTLTATADDDFTFAAWSEPGCTTGSCALTVDADLEVTVGFTETGAVAFESIQAIDGSDAIEGDGVTNVWAVDWDGGDPRPLTHYTVQDTYGFSPAWSPDGQQVAYISEGALDGGDAPSDNLVYNIWRVAPDGTGAVALTALTAAGASSYDPRWSPDGSKILFYSSRSLDGDDAANDGGTTNIWVMDADGGDPTPLTAMTATGAHSADAHWSPDGTRIVYRSRRALGGGDDPATEVSNIWVMDADGDNGEPLTALTTSGIVQSGPEWSPDGAMIAYRSTRALSGGDDAIPDTVFNVWFFDLDTGADQPLTRYTTAMTYLGNPHWSPDRAHILFDSAAALDGSDTVGPDGNLWIMDIDGSDARPLTALTAAGYGAGQPSWSTHGTKITYLSSQALDGSDASAGDVVNVWALDAGGPGAAPLTRATTAGVHASVPRWGRSP